MSEQQSMLQQVTTPFAACISSDTTSGMGGLGRAVAAVALLLVVLAGSGSAIRHVQTINTQFAVRNGRLDKVYQAGASI